MKKTIDKALGKVLIHNHEEVVELLNAFMSTKIAENIALNSGFESDFTSWSSAGTSGNGTISTSTKLEGSKSAKIANTANYIYKYQDIAATTGDKLYIAVSSLLESATNPSAAEVMQRIGISDFGTASTNVERPDFGNTTGSWVRKSVVRTVTGGIRLTLGRGINTTATYYFDGIVVINLTALYGAGNEPNALKVDELLSSLTGGYFSSTHSFTESLLTTSKLAGNIALNNGFESDLTSWTRAGTTANATISTDVKLDGAKSFKFVNANNNVYAYQDIAATTGDKLYVAMSSLLESASDTTSSTVMQRAGIADLGSFSTNLVRPNFESIIGSWVRKSLVTTAANNGIRLTLGRAVNSTSTYYFDDIVVINLTQLYGAGNEPTAAEMDTILSSLLNGYFSSSYEIISAGNVFDSINTKITEDVATALEEAISEINPTTYWDGKTINIIGDSITAAGAGTTNFGDVAAEEVGATTVNNYGINGSMIAVQESSPTTRDPIVTRYTGMADAADLVIVAAGTNDWQYGLCPFGTMASRSSYDFYGAMHNLCVGLLEKYVGKTVMFMTPIKRMQDPLLTQESTNANGKTLFEYCDVIKEVCAYYGIPVLDMNRLCPLDPHIESQFELYFDAVGTHPSAAGHVIMAKTLAGFLRQLA